MVRSPKSLGGAVGATLGNAPYGDGDRNVMGFDLAANQPFHFNWERLFLLYEATNPTINASKPAHQQIKAFASRVSLFVA
ncbi:MAG: hypothetical protein ACKOCS_04405 [Microcystis sp.]